MDNRVCGHGTYAHPMHDWAISAGALYCKRCGEVQCEPDRIGPMYLCEHNQIQDDCNQCARATHACCARCGNAFASQRLYAASDGKLYHEQCWHVLSRDTTRYVIWWSGAKFEQVPLSNGATLGIERNDSHVVVSVTVPNGA